MLRSKVQVEPFGTLLSGICLSLILTLLGCGGGSAPPDPIDPPVVFDFDFNTDATGWIGGSAQYPVANEPNMLIDTGNRALPAPLSGNGFYLYGQNLSDDLFLYAKRRVTGLRPNTPYGVTFSVSFATRALAVGGSSMIVKAGGSTTEPNRIVVTENGQPYYEMNVDTGQPTQGGANAVVLGDITKPNQNSSEFEIKSLAVARAVIVRSDAMGEAWVLIGVDSAFEVVTEVYFTRVRATFQP